MTELRIITAEPVGKGVISLLEELLAEARAGEISSIAVATIDREGVPTSRFSRAPSLTTLIGGVTMLQADLIEYLKS